MSFDEAEQILARAQQAAELEANKILSDSGKEAKQIGSEAMEQGKKETGEVRSKVLNHFAECTRVINEAKQKLEQVVQATDEPSGEKPEYSREALVKPDFTEEKMEVSEPIVRIEMSLAAAEAGSTKLYQGDVELEVTSPDGFGQVGRFTEYLRKVPDIELKSIDGFVEGKTTAIISIAEPLPLIRTIKEIPLVDIVVEQENNIKVGLKTR